MTTRFATLLVGLAFAAGCVAEGVGDGSGASTVVTSDCTVDGFGTLPVGDAFEGSALGLPDGFAEGTWVHLGPETVVPGDCDCDDDDDDDDECRGGDDDCDDDDDDDECRGRGDDCDDDDECRGGDDDCDDDDECRGRRHDRDRRGDDCDDDDDECRGRGDDCDDDDDDECRGDDDDECRGDDCDDDDDECRDRGDGPRDDDWGDHRGEGHGVCECEDEVTRDRFEGTVEAVTCFINGSRIGTVEGSGSFNGEAGYTFEVGVVDSGVSNDEYTFTVYDSTGAVVYTVNGFPDSGDLTVVDL